MPSMLENAAHLNAEDQSGFNLAVWEKVLADTTLARLAFRVETDRHGQLIMSPPPAPDHGERQAEIASILKRLLSAGVVITECPVSTTEGVKAVDVVWISRSRHQAQRRKVCFTQAPEICVEVISPANTKRELREKKDLFFASGALEVWFCDQRGKMEFFVKDAPDQAAASKLCPTFPAVIPTID
jgi:Uma2 family endonuclease